MNSKNKRTRSSSQTATVKKSSIKDSFPTNKKHFKKHSTKGSFATENKHYLTLLSKSKQKNRRNKLLDVASTGEIKAISECVKNIVEGNVAISNKDLHILKRHKQVLRSIAQRCYPVKRKRSLLKQKGGFLFQLLPLAISALTGLFGQK